MAEKRKFKNRFRKSKENPEFHINIPESDPEEWVHKRTDKGIISSAQLKDLRVLRMAQQAAAMMHDRITLDQIANTLKSTKNDISMAMLNCEERSVRRDFIEHAVDTILDIEHKQTRKEIADKLGITMRAFRVMIDSDDFKDIYNNKFATLKNDPNIKTVQHLVVEELLPEAYRALRDALAFDAPWNVRQKAYQDVFKIAGIEAVKPQQSDKAAASEFLKKNNVNINIIGSDVPAEYKEALGLLEDEVVVSNPVSIE